MTATENHLLVLNGITKQFPGVLALDEVTLRVQRGEVHGLVGQNGAGKSTLMNVLFGLLKPDAGHIEFDGQIYEALSPAIAAKVGIAMVPQMIQNQPTTTVGENLFVGDWPMRNRFTIDWSGLYRSAQETFDRMGVEVNARAPMSTLSIGQQQMVEIARALRRNAKLIVLDEPTPPLTTGEIEVLFSLIRSLKDQGVTFVYISHFLQEIFDICDYVTVMKDGRAVTSCPVASIDITECIRAMVGRDVTLFPERAAYAEDDIALEVRGLNTERIHDVSFHVRKGEIVGLAGLTGAGRTEVAKAIYGLDPLLSGEVYVEGRKVNISQPQDALDSRVAYLPEDRRGEGALLIRSVSDNITLSSLSDITGPFGFLMRRKERNIAQGWVDSLGIRTPSLQQMVALLSGGNQQKVVLARLLAADARVFMLDEPTVGIDVGAKAEIHRLINELAERGCGVLLISSDIEELLAMSDRVIVLYKGAIAGELAKKDATPDLVLLYSEGQKPPTARDQEAAKS